MAKTKPLGSLHTLPADLKKELKQSHSFAQKWKTLTPLARNEWICWIISVAKAETRHNHLSLAKEEVSNGKRRPCCFAGCSHRF
jgi:uncharacterized protein YdeI (YjbR/CyaY-like superfamily)